VTRASRGIGDPERLGMARYRTYDRTRATALVRGLLAGAEDVLAPV
jgi:hypothetical protein